MNDMDDNKPDLSARYYIAEASVWILGVILLVARFLGLAPSQPLPMLNVTLENPQYFSRVVAAMLSAATLYLILEWKQSSPTSHRAYLAQVRAGFTTLFSCASLWLCYSLIAANTRFADISPAWYFTFIAVGCSIGLFVSIAAFSSLMIRTQVEAKTIHLPRVPVATRAMFVKCIPVVLILLVIYYMLWYFTPDVLKCIGPLLVALAYILMFRQGVALLFFSQDEHGKYISYRKRIARFKEIHNTHDYAYVLHEYGGGGAAVQKLDLTKDVAPQVIQKAMQEKFLNTQSQTPINYRVQILEETQLQFYFKDGNPKNQSLKNRGVRIHKPHGKRETLRVLFILVDPKHDKQEFTIPIDIVESYAEEYISTNPDHANEMLAKAFQYAVEQAIIRSMTEQAGPVLQRAVERGQEQQVRYLLKQDLDVNERAEAGWTALLYAAAQGYPRIVRLLLDAGANPDMGNVHGITPLMYGARYKNVDVCKLLLEHGANLDLQDVYGMTALMIATLVGSGDVAGILLKAGANTNIKDRNDMTALDIAHKHKQGKIAKMIRTAKATK
jgi:cytochrome oxidase Cu insertion factor (SCO1/SenC/PrrC family)